MKYEGEEGTSVSFADGGIIRELFNKYYKNKFLISKLPLLGGGLGRGQSK